MKPPSSDAEPLRDEHASQVRASNRFLVAADEFRNLEAVIIRFGSPLVVCDASAGGYVVVAVCVDSVYVVFLIGTSAHWRRRPRVLDAWFVG